VRVVDVGTVSRQIVLFQLAKEKKIRWMGRDEKTLADGVSCLGI
jgi:hypothetical protein